MQKKKFYSAFELNVFRIAIVVIGTVTAARITPNTASSLSMTRVERKVLFILIRNKDKLLYFFCD